MDWSSLIEAGIGGATGATGIGALVLWLVKRELAELDRRRAEDRQRLAAVEQEVARQRLECAACAPRLAQVERELAAHGPAVLAEQTAATLRFVTGIDGKVDLLQKQTARLEGQVEALAGEQKSETAELRKYVGDVERRVTRRVESLEERRQA